MGLDVYVGPLTRYLRRDHTEPLAIRDDRAVAAVREWQAGLAQALGRPVAWDESADLPYWTDEPDWDGFGAVVLVAAYDALPHLRPGSQIPTVHPVDFAEAEAVREAKKCPPDRYPSLLLGVEWWLPVELAAMVFGAPTPRGQTVLMAGVDQLLAELRELNERTLRLSPGGLDAARRAGPPAGVAPVEVTARYGLGVLLPLAERAARQRQPFLVDY